MFFVSTSRSDWLRLATLALAYFVTAKLGLSLALVGHSVTLFWPPSGIALAMLLLFGIRLWPGVLLGALLTNLSGGLPVMSATGISIGSTFEAWIGAYILSRHSQFDLKLGRPIDVLNLVWWGGLFSAMISALNGAFWLAWPSAVIPWEHYWQIALSWWMGDTLGVMLFAPALITFYHTSKFEWTPSLRRMALAMFSALILLCGLTFTNSGVNLFGHQPEEFVLMPVVFWAALAFDLRVLSVVLLIVFGSALFSMITGVGFYSQNTLGKAVDMWLYITLLASAGIIFSANNSRRKQIEEALTKSEIRYRMVYEHANDAIFLAQGDRFIDCNEKALTMFGSRKIDMIGKSPIDFSPSLQPDGQESPLKALSKIQAAYSGNPQVFEWKHSRLDGQLFDAEVSLNAFDLHGEPCLQGIVRDITDRKKSEEALQLASMVYENSSEAILVTDAENLIIAVNPAFEKMTGYAFDEVRGKNPRIFKSGRHEKEFYQAMWQSLNTEGYWHDEIWDKRKDGEIHAKLLTINTIKDHAGAVFRYVAMFTDITERKKFEELMWKQANFDGLTKLPNRQMFHDRLEQDAKKSHRAGLPMALLLIDLDHFKEVNDTLGHDKGDLLLIEAAQRITSCVRESDTVARLGGDEFTVILSDLDDLPSVERIAQDIIGKLAIPFRVEAEEIYISASIGISLYPNDTADLDAFFKNADQAMYAAKNAGRNRFSYFTPDLQEAAQKRMHLTNDLRVALASNQFRVYYQPIVELSTGRIFKAEALIRWQHPERGLVSPMDFIPLAEETGLIIPIGNWVFRQAVQQVKLWRNKGHKSFQISVNKSPVQMSHMDSKDSWPVYLEQQGVPGRAIAVEITEGLLMNAEAEINEKLLEFRDAGIKVAIDDFGTGYSSLSYLKKFDIDYLKIDQSFVRQLGRDVNDLALCEAIIVMAHKLGLKVIAEGVETELQRDLLLKAECDYAQGYLFSRPVPPEEFEKLLPIG